MGFSIQNIIRKFNLNKLLWVGLAAFIFIGLFHSIIANDDYLICTDGTLIEFVETHKVPIMKKLGWYLDLRKRPPGKALPTWMLKAMGMSRVKDKG